jgi:ATP-dependent DNA helicase RecG
MGPELDTNIQFVKGIGEKRAKLLNKLGIETLFDLVSYFPRDYEDRTAIRAIRETQPGENACVRAMAAQPVRSTRIRKGLEISRLRVVDESGAMELTFFNQSYVKNSIKQGQTYIFFGKVEGNLLRREMNNPSLRRRRVRDS